MHPIIPLLQLVHFLGRIEGRKKLQKMVHILKELGAPFPETFEYSYYGMYSRQLKDEVATLQCENLLSEEEHLGMLGPVYAVSATSTLGDLLAEFHLETPPKWVERAQQLNKISPQKLEGISTVLFLRRTEGNHGAIRSRLLSLKPHLANIADECLQAASQLAPVN